MLPYNEVDYITIINTVYIVKSHIQELSFFFDDRFLYDDGIPNPSPVIHSRLDRRLDLQELLEVERKSV